MKKFMKKLILPLMLVLLVSLTTTGCTNDTDTVETQSGNSDVEDEIDETVKDIEDDVRDMNYSDIKVTPEEVFDKFMELHPDAKIKEVDLDKELMEYQYVVEGYDDNNDYEVKINPVDGKIISDDSELVDLDDENAKITKAHLAKVDTVIDKAKKEDGSDSELDEWNMSVEDGKVVMDVEIGLIEYSYDIETEVLIEKEVEDNDFTDIGNEDTETQKAILALNSKGIIVGITELEFKPDELITREEFTVAMVKGFYELDKTAKASFKDVKENDENYAYIATSEKENIVKGYPNDLFKGSENITTEDLLTISSRVLIDSKKYDYPENAKEMLKFEDKDEIFNYAVKEVALAANEGIIANTKSKLEPQDTVTRAEAAVIINRLIKKLY